MQTTTPQRPWVLFAIVFMLLVALTPLFLGSRNDQSTTFGTSQNNKVVYDFQKPSEADLQGKQVVDVGVYILSVGNLDTRTGTYTIDFFLNFRCETKGCDPTDFDIMNAASKTVDTQTTDEDIANNFYYYRIRANLQTNLNLREFPFDKHTLAIEFEDKNLARDKYIFVADPTLSGIDSEVYVAGWNLQPYILGVEKAHVYPIYSDEYSRVQFAINIFHPWSSSFMKGLFAAIVIVGAGMLSFLLKENEARDRITLSSGTLASAIFYHMTLTASVPPVGYLTYADRFMILQYLFIATQLVVAITLFLLQRPENDTPEHKQLSGQIHRTTRWLIPIGWVVAMVALQLTTFGL
jgi:hypothetical protein